MPLEPDQMRVSKALAEEVLQVLDMAQAGTCITPDDFQEAAHAYESFWAVMVETFPLDENA